LTGSEAGRGVQALLRRKGDTYARGRLGALRVTRSIRHGTYTVRVIIDGEALAIQTRLR
jgi:hypothetical protein